VGACSEVPFLFFCTAFFFLKLHVIGTAVHVELRSPTANWLWRGEAGRFFARQMIFSSKEVRAKNRRPQHSVALRCRMACEAWAWLTAAQNSEGCASADIARRVSIGSRAVFVCEHVYMSVGKNRPTATGLKSGCVGFRGMASGLAKAHITATEEAAKRGKTMTGTVRHEPGWRGFFIRAAAEETS